MENKYSYSPKEVEEAKAIRNEFMREGEREIDKLRLLKKKTESRARIPSIIIGVIAAVVFGCGFCLTLFIPQYFIFGIIIGLVGLAGMALTYPLYHSNLEKEKDRVKSEVEMVAASIING